MSQLYIEQDAIDRANKAYKDAIEAVKNAKPEEMKYALAAMKATGDAFRALIRANYS